jgi:succinate dehydrogenase/fumarate reductase flavoprotein subunit
LLTLPGVTLTNTRGERFMGRHDPDRLEQSDRATLARAIHDEVVEGRGSPGGGVYLDLRSVDVVELDRHRPGFFDFCRDAGLDPRTQLLETAPSAHTCLGGLVVDAERRVMPGLYAAGEAAGGVHGANRLSSNSLSDALVSGWQCGEQAALDAKGVAARDPGSSPELPKSGEADALQVTTQLRALMGSTAGVVREGGRMEQALEELGLMHEQTQAMRLTGVVNTDDWLDLVSLIETGRAVLTAALARTESRGAHYRSDYPDLDNKHWRGNLFLTRGGETIHYQYEPLNDET